MSLKKWFRSLATVTLCLAFAGTALAADLEKVRTAWLDGQETFPMWYAKQKGWDKEAGLDVEMLYFGSGMEALKSLPAGEWGFGSINAVPAMIGALRYNLYVVGNANDEALSNGVMVRPDSPIYKTKGYNKDFPEVYGHPDDVRGKTILCTNISSSHFALSSWLKVLGLKETDVVIKNMDQPQALAAFDYGIGDVVSLWAPLMYVGQARGWKIASTPQECKQGLPMVLVADKKFADSNPETTAKLIGLYMRAINMIQKETPEALAPEYMRYYEDWTGRDYTSQLASLDIKSHPVFNLDQQLRMFDASAGPSQAQIWQTNLARFFASVGRISQDELEKIEDSSYVTDKFLRLVKTPVPDYK